jgi:hypothetical protein
MKQCPSWESISSSFSGSIFPQLLRNWKVHYRVTKNSPLVVLQCWGIYYYYYYYYYYYHYYHLLFPCLVKCGVPQGSTLGPLIFNIFINDICDSIYNSQCLLFVDDLKIYRSISEVDDCKRLQHDIDSVQNWCLDNGMKLNLSKTNIISFTRKTNSIYFNYKLFNSLGARSQCVKDLGVLLDCKLYFHQHVNYIFSQSLKMLGLIRYITSSFSTLDSLLVVRSKIKYASVVWNSYHYHWLLWNGKNSKEICSFMLH